MNVLQNHAQQLIGCESKNAEHQVRHDLQVSPDPDHSSSELVFEPGVRRQNILNTFTMENSVVF